MENEVWEVDHIIPSGEIGGNNSLINLQATTHYANFKKGTLITDSQYCFNDNDFIKYNLDQIYHIRLSDRMLINIPVGWEALSFLNPYFIKKC